MTDPFTSMEFAGPGRWLGVSQLGFGVGDWPADAMPSGSPAPSATASPQRGATPSGSTVAPGSERVTQPGGRPLGDPVPPRTGPRAPHEQSRGARRAA